MSSTKRFDPPFAVVDKDGAAIRVLPGVFRIVGDHVVTPSGDEQYHGYTFRLVAGKALGQWSAMDVADEAAREANPAAVARRRYLSAAGNVVTTKPRATPEVVER